MENVVDPAGLELLVVLLVVVDGRLEDVPAALPEDEVLPALLAADVVLAGFVSAGLPPPVADAPADVVPDPDVVPEPDVVPVDPAGRVEL